MHILPYRYDEVCSYRFDYHGFQKGLGHFSQMVWKGSTELGMGRYTGKYGAITCTYIVARYRTTGNINSSSKFQANIEKGDFDYANCSGP